MICKVNNLLMKEDYLLCFLYRQVLYCQANKATRGASKRICLPRGSFDCSNLFGECQYSSSLKYVFLRGYQSHPLILCDFGDSYFTMKGDKTPLSLSPHHVNYHSNKSFKEPIYTCKSTKKMDNRKVLRFLFCCLIIK